MPTVVDSGTINTDGTEQTLASPIFNRSYVLWLDFNAMQATETMVIRSKRKVLASGSVREFSSQTFEGVQSPPIQCLVPVSLPTGGTFTIERTAGTDRAIPWSLESL